MEINKKFLLHILLCLLILSNSTTAATAPPSPGSIDKDPITFVTETVFTILTITWIVSIGFITIMFAMAGFKYLTAQGDPNKISEANRAVIWSTAGILVIVLAWSIITLVRRQFSI